MLSPNVYHELELLRLKHQKEARENGLKAAVRYYANQFKEERRRGLKLRKNQLRSA